ncbi:branched-chain amino acid ABC transporter ATP-binding protein/permease [Micromonospora cathayae]|uniref:Branched-chain amino acid ABC transporter ATP-binding protein/permease n=1 Tax=Micromonospora cathayae TaxID=3028804 RepID=A0ABY7ZLB6_9ACTN|nr:branched-chain amino acid ABC transporter ATP-binding protein/permease [Micromonospora sp. HUAS 3]WDZ83797.1 branched-chain amino acid ABC transporter ATP-binding protein/permease [Micromonospora sp. HUAS 3]
MIENLFAQYGTIAQIALIYAILTLAGFAAQWAGLLSLLPVPVAALTGYCGAILVEHVTDVPAVVVLLGAAVLGGAVSLLLSYPLLRLRSHWIALATIALLLVTRVVVLNVPATGGAQGMPVWQQTGWVHTLVILALAAWWLARIRRSRLGLATEAVRADLDVAGSLGVDPTAIRRIAMVNSGALAGLAGVLLANTLQYIGPTTYYLDLGFTMLAALVLGGRSHWIGAIVGAVVFTAIPQVSTKLLTHGEHLLNGVALIAIMLFLPGGLFEPGRRARRLGARAARREAETEAETTETAAPPDTAAASRLDGVAEALTGGDAGAEPGRRDRDSTDADTEAGTRNGDRIDAADDAATRAGTDHPAAGAASRPATTATPRPAAAGGGAVRADADPAAPPAVEVTGVGKSFGGVAAVDDLTLTVPTGRVLGILGPNGAGKSTAMDLIAGNQRVDQGTIRIFGRDVTRAPAHQRVRTGGIARTYQEVRLFDGLTVLENIMAGAYVRRNSRAWQAVALLPTERRERRVAEEQARELMDRVGVIGRPDQYAGTLSYANQRRVEIARALAAGPRLLLLDEPTAGMHHHGSAAVGELVHRLRDDGLTLVLVEHNMRLIKDYCDQAAVMSLGTLLVQGDPATCLDDPRVKEAYLGKRSDAERVRALLELRKHPGGAQRQPLGR